MRKYQVVSYDADENQWFWDFVAAKSEEHAETIVCNKRPYVIAADAVSVSELQSIANRLRSRSIARIKEDFKHIY